MNAKEPPAAYLPAGTFKAKCLAILDEVALTGRSVIVTKRGKPVARIVPLEEQPPRDLQGSILWEGDVISPIEEEWGSEENP